MESAKLKISFPMNDCTFHIRSSRRNVAPESELYNEPDKLKSFASDMHKHFYIEFQYVFAGEVLVESDDNGSNVRALRAGDYCFIPSNTYHHIQMTPDTERYCFTLSIEYNKSSKNLGFSHFFHYNQIINSIRTVKFHNEKIIQAYMNQYRAIVNSPNMQTTGVQQHLLPLLTILHVLDTYYRDSMATQQPHKSLVHSTNDDYDRKWIIECFIGSRYSEDIRISDLSKLLYLSDRQTRTVVKKIMGEDYKDLIIKQRMEMADILISKTNLTLEEISRKVGYSSYSSFYAAYIKHNGVSPCNARTKNIGKD